MTGRRPRIDDLLELVVEMGGSDLHFAVGQPPIIRVVGEIRPLRLKTMSAADYDQIVGAVVPPDLWRRFQAEGDLDWAYEAKGVGRFRSNLFQQENGPAAVFRLVPSTSMSFAELGVPEEVARLGDYPSGLVLVTGPTGSGKSTTLASIIDHINENRKCHVVTIEDPIEYVHSNKNSRITQREIGTSARTFNDALRVAVREDPDVILVGELRDLETISMALQSAETGVLVLATLHTNSAARTVDRIINVFPSEEQDAIRTMFAGVLRGILAQQLLPRKTGGRIPAVDLLFWTTGLPNMIREGKPHLIQNLIRTGRRAGMVAMDDSLMDLVRRGVVSAEHAHEKALDKNEFSRVLATKFGLSV
ncbi:MAG: type IV pilus twitching motility protein PilT [Deltaproteobacteria bacterium]|nr:type IV pilus twitching motility protein PilT [Deltaproteobacteria bacterium]